VRACWSDPGKRGLKKRSDIGAQIKQLNEARAKHLAEAEKTAAKDEGETFESAAVKTEREQMKAKGYEVEK